MMRFSWWHMAVAATIVGLAVIVLPDLGAKPSATIGAWCCLGVLGIGYAAFGWRNFTARGDGTFPVGHAVLLFPLLAIACTGVGTAFDPSMATLQAIGFPIIWFSVDPLRRAIILNVVLALAVTFGFLVSTGTGSAAVGSAIAIESISLMFSIALGLWFTFALQQGQDNTRLLGELQAAQEKLAILNRDSGILSERERLAGEIHDTIAQSLTGLVMVAQRSQSQVLDALPAVRADLALIEEIAREALVETRALVASVAPVDVNGGLGAALGRLIERFTRETGVQITLDTSEYEAQPNEVEVVLLRCVQEALANVRKHSGARTVSVRLSAVGGAVSLCVSDDGAGMTVGQPVDRGFGLAGMQQRLSLAGGTLVLGRSAAGGVELRVE
ncbi:sensor histidine kinase, partial [Subtercola sp. RTI3]|uniref:sensor histidine kinase n=1 Tax=Subtercola sp. RTI3 TaxID=3048639 RepID=UPI002B2382FF